MVIESNAQLYADCAIAAAVVRITSLSGERDLVMGVSNEVGERRAPGNQVGDERRATAG